jgi:Zn-dependent peptidase ImmA (M78 family)
MSVKNYDKQSLEKISEDFLKKNARGKYDNRALLIESLIESFGYHIFPIPGLAEIAEAYIPAKPGYIFVDEQQYLNGTSFRWRFTIAEELAHILIHRPIFEGKTIKEITKIQDDFSDSDYQTIEKNAKYLAGCILMPRQIFMDRFTHFAEIQSQTTSNTLKILKYVVRQVSLDFNASCYTVSPVGFVSLSALLFHSCHHLWIINWFNCVDLHVDEDEPTFPGAKFVRSSS